MSERSWDGDELGDRYISSAGGAGERPHHTASRGHGVRAGLGFAALCVMLTY